MTAVNAKTTLDKLSCMLARWWLGVAASLLVACAGESKSGEARNSTLTACDPLAPADLTYLAGGPSAINPAGGPSTLTIAGTAYPLTEGRVPASASYFCLSK